MSILYAESSAVLAWLLDEPNGKIARQLLATATQVVASELTLLEVGRGLLRHAAVGGIDAATHVRLQTLLDRAAAGWTRLAIDDRILARARQPFPVEPVRSLDAIHLASIALVRAGLGPLRVLSLDQRLRANAEAWGISSAPV